MLDQKSDTFTGSVKRVLKTVLQVEDPVYADEIFPFFSRLFHKRLQKKLDNIKSKYRADITQEGESVDRGFEQAAPLSHSFLPNCSKEWQDHPLPG